jgi:hypothetical protein
MLNVTVENTFQALVDAILPRTPLLAQEYGRIQYYGALDQQIDQFLIYELNQYPIPMAAPTAEILNMAAALWRRNMGYYGPVSFAMLSPIERFSALGMLLQQVGNPAMLELISQENPELSISAISMLDTYTLMGYYSEWYGYGTTRLKPPDERTLEFTPLSWEQVGYPGPSLGYRALRGTILGAE